MSEKGISLENSSILEILPFFLLKYILTFINDNITFYNARLVCNSFYKALDVYKTFNNKLIETQIYFKNNNPYMIESFMFSHDSHDSNILYKIIYYKHNVKHGPAHYYNNIGQLIKTCHFFNNKLDGYLTNYTNNRIVRKCLYIHGQKHGWEHTFRKNKCIRYDRKYEFGNLIVCNKIYKNSNIYRMSFKNGMLNGHGILYFNRFNIKKNELNFTSNRLDGNIIIRNIYHTFKCIYNLGYQEGIQCTYSHDNTLEFVGEYRNNCLNGNYLLFDNNSKIESGEVDIFGRYNKCIQFNPDDFQITVYPFKKNVLNGTYYEHHKYYYLQIMFKEDEFNGFFTFNDFINFTTSYMLIHNSNNFEYYRHVNGKCIYILKKTFGKYVLTVLDEVEHKHKIYDLTYFLGNKEGFNISYDWV